MVSQSFTPEKSRRRILQATRLTEAPLWPDNHGFMRLINADSWALNPVTFVRKNKAIIEQWLHQDGACLLRGFDISEVQDFANTVSEFGERLPYIERAAKRTEVYPGVFTSTELAADVPIPQHHEMSYASQWPQRLYFWCQHPPSVAGQTPLASERCVSQALDPQLRRKFEEKGLLYIRNFRASSVDLSWQETFGTDKREDVINFSKLAGFKAQWDSEDNLKTIRHGPAMVNVGDTKERLWFNHSHLFHPTNLSEEIRRGLIANYGQHALPRDVRFGDGTPIPDEDILAIRQTYEKHAVTFQWQTGDLLIINNFLVTHGRQAFSGRRRILVAMTNLHHLLEN